MLNQTEISNAIKAIKSSNRIVIVQAENPDGDSLGSAIALEEVLAEAGKQVSLYCSVDLPRHLHYIPGWERVSKDLPADFDLLIIVDAVALSLLEKLYIPANMSKLQTAKTLLIDHHSDQIDLPIENPICLIDTTAVSAGQVVYELLGEAKLKLPKPAAEALVASILSDSLGLTSAKTTARSIYVLAELVENYQVNLAELDNRRREYGKKPIEILKYKADLIKRIEYYLSNKLAVVVISKTEIESYSDLYNPGALIQEELRNVEEVDISVVLKDYDGKITGRLRANNTHICDQVADYFGGGGHPFAAGFKTDKWKMEDLKPELVKITDKLLREHAKAN